MNIKKYIDIFKALSDNMRLRIMRLLIQAGKELCVCEIMDSLHESQYNVSRHLRELKLAGLVRERKAGRWVFYSLTETAEKFQKLILHAVESIPKNAFSNDIKRLKVRLSLREGEKCVIGLKSPEWRKIITQLQLKGRIRKA
ncbi:MAG: metalloregulator ArsR/SmtB family transcription factor [Nitrospirota bacterium]